MRAIVQAEGSEHDMRSQPPDQDIATLLAAWKHEQVRRRRRLRRQFAIGLGATVAAGGVRILGNFGCALGWWGRAPDFWQVCLIFGQLSGVLSMTAIWFVSKRQKQTMENLAQCNDIRAVAPLLEALQLPSVPHAKFIVEALSRLLPLLRASDASLLTAQHRSMLTVILIQKTVYHDIGYTHMGNLQIAVLKAMEQVGDGKALPAVLKLAKQPVNDPLDREVRLAACACLPFIQQRAESERIGGELLRASAKTTDDLLLPAQALSPVEPHVLLRASDTQE